LKFKKTSTLTIKLKEKAFFYLEACKNIFLAHEHLPSSLKMDSNIYYERI